MSAVSMPCGPRHGKEACIAELTGRHRAGTAPGRPAHGAGGRGETRPTCGSGTRRPYDRNRCPGPRPLAGTERLSWEDL
ncbi:hypothetical protein Saso_50040 [Streptomyces asoensis]|uniref:Uncharacterized protein n=1 Tax=Streptomyces asoensis TaxID=249586 RepID=A0ABQ3S5E4_9ACTN|nr:hypothetical protein Saso_50040 [Streptomyces asoensis]